VQIPFYFDQTVLDDPDPEAGGTFEKKVLTRRIELSFSLGKHEE
jgi:hypothetical protein